MDFLVRNNDRGITETKWLKSWHTFSFGEYYDRTKMNFGVLRVFNDDIISPDTGFDFHPHSNFEIITIMFKGTIQHKDTLGNIKEIIACDVQVMTAGSGIYHSEINPSKSENAELFQIWIKPNKLDLEPRYDQKSFNFTSLKNEPLEIVNGIPDSNKSLFVNQDVKFSLLNLEKNFEYTYKLNENKSLFTVVIDGEVLHNNLLLFNRDSIGIKNISQVTLKSLTNSFLLLIELPIN